MVSTDVRSIDYLLTLDKLHLDDTFKGKAVHAASQPDQGINALDGLILTFVGLNALRQQLRPDARVMGVISEGGVAANIIPDRAVGRFSLRALDRAYRDEIIERFSAVTRGAAESTGATLDLNVRKRSAYDNMVPNRALADRYGEHLRALCLDAPQHSPVERIGRN